MVFHLVFFFFKTHQHDYIIHGLPQSIQEYLKQLRLFSVPSILYRLDWLGWCFEGAREMTSFLQFSLTFEVLRDKPALGFYCRSQEMMVVSQSAWFLPLSTPLQPSPLKHPLCLPGTGRNNSRKNKALVSPPISEQSRSCFVFWLKNTEAVLNALRFVSIFLPIFCCFNFGLHTWGNCLISKV